MEIFPLLLPRKSSRYLLTPSSEGLYILTSSDICWLPMLIPGGFQCLVVVQRNSLGEFGCIRSLWVAPCEFGCTPCLLNRVVSTWLHRVNSLSPRTGLYVLGTLLSGCIEGSRCIRVQTTFFADVHLTLVFITPFFLTFLLLLSAPSLPFSFLAPFSPFFMLASWPLPTLPYTSSSPFNWECSPHVAHLKTIWVLVSIMSL